MPSPCCPLIHGEGRAGPTPTGGIVGGRLAVPLPAVTTGALIAPPRGNNKLLSAPVEVAGDRLLSTLIFNEIPGVEG